MNVQTIELETSLQSLKQADKAWDKLTKLEIHSKSFDLEQAHAKLEPNLNLPSLKQAYKAWNDPAEFATSFQNLKQAHREIKSLTEAYKMTKFEMSSQSLKWAHKAQNKLTKLEIRSKSLIKTSSQSLKQA